MLQLNSDLLRAWRLQPPSKIAVIIRSSGNSIKAAVKSLLRYARRRRPSDMETRVVEEKTAEKALKEYRQTLQKTFGSSERIDEVLEEVSHWLNNNGDL